MAPGANIGADTAIFEAVHLGNNPRGAAGLLVGRVMRSASGSIEDALGSPSGTSLPPSALLAAQQPPEASAAFASLIER